MDIAERIKKRMKSYGYETMEEMIVAMKQQEPVDIGIFTTPLRGQTRYEENSKLA